MEEVLHEVKEKEVSAVLKTLLKEPNVKKGETSVSLLKEVMDAHEEAGVTTGDMWDFFSIVSKTNSFNDSFDDFALDCLALVLRMKEQFKKGFKFCTTSSGVASLMFGLYATKKHGQIEVASDKVQVWVPEVVFDKLKNRGWIVTA